MSASTLLHSLFRYKAWANDELFAELEKLDPVAQAAQHTAIVRLLNHIYVVDCIFAAHLAGTAHGYTATNTPETPTLAGLRSAVAQQDRWYADYIANLPAERLTDSLAFVFTDGSKGTMTREEMLAHVATHGGYHRGGVGRLMREVSMTPPRDIFTTFLHRTEPGRREHTGA